MPVATAPVDECWLGAPTTLEQAGAGKGPCKARELFPDRHEVPEEVIKPTKASNRLQHVDGSPKMWEYFT